jgi:hypothetical protein
VLSNSLPPAPILGPDHTRMRRDVDYLLASPGLSHLAPISFPARSKIRKPEQSTKLCVSVSLIAF